MSGDLISRSALWSDIQILPHNGDMISSEEVEQVIMDAQTIEAVPVVQGEVKTVIGKMGLMHQECSVCGNVLEWKAYPNYCNECGAKMKGGTE